MQRIALALMLAATSASAQTALRIKLGTLAPQGSTWHQLLVSMAQDFAKASDGKVELKVYAGDKHPHAAQKPAAMEAANG